MVRVSYSAAWGAGQPVACKASLRGAEAHFGNLLKPTLRSDMKGEVEIDEVVRRVGAIRECIGKNQRMLG